MSFFKDEKDKLYRFNEMCNTDKEARKLENTILKEINNEYNHVILDENFDAKEPKPESNTDAKAGKGSEGADRI